MYTYAENFFLSSAINTSIAIERERAQSFIWLALYGYGIAVYTIRIFTNSFKFLFAGLKARKPSYKLQAS